MKDLQYIIEKLMRDGIMEDMFPNEYQKIKQAERKIFLQKETLWRKTRLKINEAKEKN